MRGCRARAGQRSRLGPHKRIIEQVEGLGCDGGRVAVAGHHALLGEIEDGQRLGRQARATRASRRCDVGWIEPARSDVWPGPRCSSARLPADSWPASRRAGTGPTGRTRPASRRESLPPRVGAAHAATAIRFPDRPPRFPDGAVGAELVGPRQHDRSHEPLDRPAVADESPGKVIEQLGMRRHVAGHAEIVDGFDDSFAEEMMPDAIHDHPRSERILRAGEPLREFEPAALLDVDGGLPRDSARRSGTRVARWARAFRRSPGCGSLYRRPSLASRAPSATWTLAILTRTGADGKPQHHLRVEVIETAAPHLVAERGTHVGAAEDSGQRVIVGRRNRLELVVVAAGATGRQGEDRAGHRVDLLVDVVHDVADLESLVDVLHSQCQKAGGDQMLGSLGRRRRRTAGRRRSARG